jgi:hypothetical protein
MFVRGLLSGFFWYPQTAKYAPYGGPLEWFVRLKNSDETATRQVLGVASFRALEDQWAGIQMKAQSLMSELSFHYDVKIDRLIGIDKR